MSNASFRHFLCERSRNFRRYHEQHHCRNRKRIYEVGRAPFNVGDTVRVSVKVKEGNRERIQAFEGIVIAKKNGSVRETFTVRRVSFGIGIERTFPLHSPRITDIAVIRHGRVRRAKLYYLRNLSGI